MEKLLCYSDVLSVFNNSLKAYNDKLSIVVMLLVLTLCFSVILGFSKINRIFGRVVCIMLGGSVSVIELLFVASPSTPVSFIGYPVFCLLMFQIPGSLKKGKYLKRNLDALINKEEKK